MLEKFKKISCFVFDVDGVLTDGKLICAPEGEIWRNMSAKDGYAIQSILKNGLQIAIITSGSHHGVLKKLENFGVTLIYEEAYNKEKVLMKFVNEHKIDLERVLFMGDDIPDYNAMKLCGLKCCPADSVPEIIEISDYVSPFMGGKGCVRDVVEKVLKAQNKWFQPNN